MENWSLLGTAWAAGESELRLSINGRNVIQTAPDDSLFRITRNLWSAMSIATEIQPPFQVRELTIKDAHDRSFVRHIF